MSQVYSTEPATTGRVVLDTTHGPIDINLWCKECPTTTRTFLQLCLDGYYDGMVFHRVLSDFLIQTGLTRNENLEGENSAAEMDAYLRRSTAVPPNNNSNSTSSSGDPLGSDRKKLELNPRIRFNHRGQVAMAFPLEHNGNNNNNNDDADEEENAMLRYQFFVTLDEAPFLDAKHVAFGTIAGPTVFNGLRIGRTDADERSGVPTDMTDCPPRIKSVKVDHHPFEDLVVTADRKIPWSNSKNGSGKGTTAGKKGTEEGGRLERRRKKRKGKRDLNVLSFGDEERDFDDVTTTKKGDDAGGSSMLSSHDVLSGESEFLSSKVDADVDERSRREKGSTTERKRGRDGPSNDKDDEKKMMKKEEASSTMTSTSNDDNNTLEAKEPMNKMHDTQENNETKKDKPNIGRRDSNGNREPEGRKPPPRSRGVGAVEARRAKYLKSGAGSSANKGERLKREGDTMARLLAFKSKVIGTKGSSKTAVGLGPDNGGGAMRHRAADDSLAARMTRRARQTEDEEDRRNEREAAFAAAPGYDGRVVNEDDDERGGDGAGWLETKFKCKRHVDHDSRTKALNGDADDLGGDGRRMDDYVVLDEKRSGRGKRDGRGERRERGGRRDGSGKDARRSHKSSGHHHRSRY